MGWSAFTNSYHEPDSWDDLPKTYDEEKRSSMGYPTVPWVVLAVVFAAISAIVIVFGTDGGAQYSEMVDAIKRKEIFLVVGAAAMVFGAVFAATAVIQHRKDENLVGWEARALGGFVGFVIGVFIFSYCLGSLPEYLDEAEAGPRTVTARLESVHKKYSRRSHGPLTVFTYETPEGERIEFVFGKWESDTIDRLKSYGRDVTVVYYPETHVLVSIEPLDGLGPVKPAGPTPEEELSRAMQDWYAAHASDVGASSEEGAS